MKSLFWAALNLIGLVILIFMYAHKDKRRSGKNAVQSAFGNLLVSIMLFLVFDTGMFLADMAQFRGAIALNYTFSMLFYIVSPLPGLFYVFYCDSKLFKDQKGLKKRTVFYLIPAVVNTLLVLTTPLSRVIFYIDEHNVYTRGPCFWFSMILAFAYIFSIYPVLAVQPKKNKASFFRGKNSYLYLFPLPPLVLAIVQIMNYGVLLIGFGCVLSAFLIYTNSIQSSDDKRSLSMRFHNLNIVQFAVISSIMVAGIFFILENVTHEISEDYAKYNSVVTSNSLETYLNKEIGIIRTTARSNALTDWVADEGNEEKKETAYNEMMNALGTMYGDNIYIVVGESGREYTMDRETDFSDFRSHAQISADNPKDNWVFEIMALEEEYNLNVDVDKEFYRKRVWLNFKIMSGGETIGIICTGMELSDIAERAILMQLGHTNSRTFIIDENGVINMDSAHLGEEDFLLYGVLKKIDEEFTDDRLLTAIQEHLDGIDGYFAEMNTQVTVLRMETGSHSYATITPIGTTNWTVVTLYDSASLFGIIRLLPLFAVIVVMLVIFAYSSNRITERMIFVPLKRLIDSLHDMRENNEKNIYGTGRSDEIGLLSNAIKDYFVKGHYDELTGIYNRRYMTETLEGVIENMRRSGGGQLSVMMLDVDFFKKYNDTYGHTNGDNCLRTVAKAIDESVTRDGDFAARYGGEEFAVVLPHTDDNGVRVISERILQNVRNKKIPHEKNEAADCVTISIGVVTGDVNAIQSGADYIKLADAALYSSKRNGRNRVTFCDV